MTLVQRFGSALNLNVHFHLLFMDGVYVNDDVNTLEFRHVAGPGRAGGLKVLSVDTCCNDFRSWGWASSVDVCTWHVLARKTPSVGTVYCP